MLGHENIRPRAWREAPGHGAATAARAPDFDWPNRGASRHVDAAGVGWHLQRMGSGPRLLLIHGTGASTHSWRELMPFLAEHFDVLAMDLPGHGFSGALRDRPMSLDGLATVTAGLLAVVEFRPDCVAGHSAGAAIALRMTLDAKISPASVVGLNAALMPFGGSATRVFAPLARLCAGTRMVPQFLAWRARDPAAVRRVLDSTGSRLDAHGVALYRRLMRSERHVAAILSMMANWDLEPLLGDLPALATPLHLVVGARDLAVPPAVADTVAGRVPGTVVTRLEGCGHLAHEEEPLRVASLIRHAYESAGTGD